MWGWMVAKSFNSSIWNYLCEYNSEHVCGKAFKFLVWQVQWGIKVEWSTKNKCIVHNFIVREHESGKVNITFWKIGYLYILLVENILVFHILFSDIICFVNSRIWWYEYCVFFIWILYILHIILTNILCVVFHVFCISIQSQKNENSPDRKIFVAKTFRIKRVNPANFQIRDKCA